MDRTSYQIDKRQVREAFSKAAPVYDELAVVQREIGQRMLERLDLIKLTPRRILDVGCGTGLWSEQLGQRYRQAELIALDLAPGMVQQARARLSAWRRRFGKQRFLCADAEQLPLATDSVDMIFSNVTLQWCQDLDRTFAEFRRVLRPGGLLIFSTFGPDTLTELRQAWAAADDAVHVNAFIDMHDIGDALLRAGVADPVMDMEKITLTYRDIKTLMRELKEIGAHNVTRGRNHGLTGKGKLARMMAAYEDFRRADGLLPVTYEVVYGHAWGAEPQTGQQNRSDGSVTVPIEQLKGRRTPERKW